MISNSGSTSDKTQETPKDIDAPMITFFSWFTSGISRKTEQITALS